MKFSTSRYRDISNRFLDEKNDIFYIKDNISYIKYIKTNMSFYTCRAQILISKKEFNIYTPPWPSMKCNFKSQIPNLKFHFSFHFIRARSIKLV